LSTLFEFIGILPSVQILFDHRKAHGTHLGNTHNWLPERFSVFSGPGAGEF
jgi:hypothetical protein